MDCDGSFVVIHSLKLTWYLDHWGWKMSFLLGRPPVTVVSGMVPLCEALLIIIRHALEGPRFVKHAAACWILRTRDIVAVSKNVQYIYILWTRIHCANSIQNCRFLTFLDYGLVIKMYLDVPHFRMEKGDSQPAKIGESSTNLWTAILSITVFDCLLWWHCERMKQSNLQHHDLFIFIFENYVLQDHI